MAKFDAVVGRHYGSGRRRFHALSIYISNTVNRALRGDRWSTTDLNSMPSILLRKIRSLWRLTLGNPLRSVLELRGRVGLIEGVRSSSQALGYQEIAESLVFAVQYVTHGCVEGDVAEFGCMTGRTAVALAAGMKWQNSDKRLFLFDSFEGLPQATSEIDRSNRHVFAGTWGPGTCLGISPAKLQRLCGRFIAGDRVRIFEGWFSNTLPTLPPAIKFALVHIDCDLYQSTYDALDYLFGSARITEGAIILFDDWDCNRASNQHGERRAWSEIEEKYSVITSPRGSYGWAGYKLIVHSYVAPKLGTREKSAASLGEGRG